MKKNNQRLNQIKERQYRIVSDAELEKRQIRILSIKAIALTVLFFTLTGAVIKLKDTDNKEYVDVNPTSIETTTTDSSETYAWDYVSPELEYAIKMQNDMQTESNYWTLKNSGKEIPDWLQKNYDDLMERRQPELQPSPQLQAAIQGQNNMQTESNYWTLKNSGKEIPDWLQDNYDDLVARQEAEENIKTR